MKKARKRRIFAIKTNPIMRIDHIKINQNAKAYKIYAIGYQNGLVRIKTIIAMKKTGSNT